MKLNKIFLPMAALALVGAMTAGCSSDDLATDTPQLPDAAGGTVTMKTTITLDERASTRALDADGKKTFAAGDQIAVIYQNTSGETIKAVSDALTAADIINSNYAEFSVTLTNPKASTPLRYIYPASRAAATVATEVATNDDATINYDVLATQDGTFASLASKLDLAVFDGTMPSETTLPAATLTNPLTIGKFTIMDDVSTDITSAVKQLTINDGSNSYIVDRTPATGPIYVAMRPVNSKDIQLTAVTSTIPYKKSVTSQTLAANNVYSVNVTMNKDIDRATPLTLEAFSTAGTTTITFWNFAAGPVKYKIDDGAEETIAAGKSKGISGLTAGQKVTFFGDNSIYLGASYSHFSCTEDCYIYGNIMSLVSSTDYATATALTDDDNFVGLFNNNDHIKNHESRALVLPATSLAEHCYSNMFNGCTNLTAAPALPATTLAYGCYLGMFNGCTNLTTAPVLPATTLAKSCYSHMFDGCTNLTTAPVLPATTLAKSCYSHMFDGCTNLTTAPVLSATTLAESCYYCMFYGCNKLSSVVCLATDISAARCLEQWLDKGGSSVSGSKTLYVDPSMMSTGTGGYDGQWWLETGWTLQPYVAP